MSTLPCSIIRLTAFQRELNYYNTLSRIAEPKHKTSLYLLIHIYLLIPKTSRFILPIGKPEEVMTDEGTMETVMQTQNPPGLQPPHKAAVVQFLERVYGIEDQMTFFRLLEDGFLPDLRAAITLEAVSVGDV